MPLLMANSKDGQGHKDIYLDTSTNIVARNAHVHYESSNIHYFVVPFQLFCIYLLYKYFLLNLNKKNEIKGIYISNTQKDITNYQHADDITLSLKDILQSQLVLLKISVSTRVPKQNIMHFIRMF